ncbi:MAG: hypothetical protein LAO04_20130 [Acidobacteriia bacterium]|nr:hypothetical protein [Terriglobia bacterium]
MRAKPERTLKDPMLEALKDLLITELAKAGVAQSNIRKIVSCDMWRVSRIARFFKKKKGKPPREA